jgi:hypothetical protein
MTSRQKCLRAPKEKPMESDEQATLDARKPRFASVDNSGKNGAHIWAPTMAPIPDPTQVTVTMADYLKLGDECNIWRRRALDAEARNGHTGDILGEGPFRAPKGKNAHSGLGIG